MAANCVRLNCRWRLRQLELLLQLLPAFPVSSRRSSGRGGGAADDLSGAAHCSPSAWARAPFPAVGLQGRLVSLNLGLES